MSRRAHSLWMYLAVTLAAFVGGAPAQAATNYLYVATDGNDAWSGTRAQPNGPLTDGPKASLQGARDAVRTLLAQAGYKWPTIVRIAGGTYSLTNPLTLGLADSAGVTNWVLYQAAAGAQPGLTGGRRIAGWTAGANGRWTAFVPGAASDANYFEQLFMDGRRATRARTPNTDYHYVQAADPVLTNRAFTGYAADVAPLAALPPTELSDATVVVYHKWSTSRLRLATVNASSRLMTFTSNARYAFNAGDRYQIENIPAALDEPGEWFLARDGTLTYWPLAGEDMNTAEVIAPQTGGFIQITGDSANGSFVQNLTFRGLSFQHGQYLLPAQGVSLSQAVPLLTAVITLNGARNIAFEDCEVAHIGQNAIALQRGCRDCVVTRCYLHDLGGGGVYIGETTQQANLNNRTTSNTIDNNIIRAGGRIHASGVGVWIGNSSDNKVTHNEIADFFYTGVSAGWTWGYGTSIASSNHIDANHIHDLGWGVLSDMGAVYTLGVAPGTTVNGNYLHHISHYSYGGWGLYNDEGSSGILLASNLVHDTQGAGYHQHFGETNTVRNNIFAHGVAAQLKRTKAETNHISFYFERNIVYWPYGTFLEGQWGDTSHFVMRSNLYWQVSSPNIDFDGNTFAQWQGLGQDASSRIADPLFQDGMNRDFRFASTAVAAMIGFQPFNFTNAGVYGTAAWRGKSQIPSQPDVLPRPVSFVPFDFNEDYEALGIGATPPKATLSGVSGGASIAVVSNSPANGKRCLAVTDAPGLPQAFYPYFSYRPPDMDGSLNYAFSIRLAANTKMYHEWRNYSGASSYTAGPSVWFDLLQMKVGGSMLTTVPSNQWLRVQITCNTSNYVTQGWNLGLTKPGLATQWWTHHPTGSSTNWNQLNWLGWVSEATSTTTFYLDDLTMTNLPRFLEPPQPPAPVISGLSNRTIAEDTSTGPLAFTVVDPAVPASMLTLSVSSSNPRLMPEDRLGLSGTGTNRTLAVTPLSSQSGIGTVFVTADNGAFHNTQSFQVTVLGRPLLSISPADTGFVLAWPPGGSEFSLWQATNLALPLNWTPVSGTPVLSNGLWRLPASAGSGRYYRLQSADTPLTKTRARCW